MENSTLTWRSTSRALKPTPLLLGFTAFVSDTTIAPSINDESIHPHTPKTTLFLRPFFRTKDNETPKLSHKSNTERAAAKTICVLWNEVQKTVTKHDSEEGVRERNTMNGTTTCIYYRNKHAKTFLLFYVGFMKKTKLRKQWKTLRNCVTSDRATFCNINTSNGGRLWRLLNVSFRRGETSFLLASFVNVMLPISLFAVWKCQRVWWWDLLVFY